MEFPKFRRASTLVLGFLLGLGILTVSAIALFAVSELAAGPASASTTGCPTNPPSNGPTDNYVGASYATTGNTTTYTFTSFVNENPVGGVPGLIEYCVYTSPQPDSSAVAPGLAGANGALWVDPPSASFFAFQRPDGDPSNIPLDGTAGITMGSATWSGTPPATQVIVLHVNDPSVCNALGQASPTCFVYPGSGVVQQDLQVTKTATPSFTRTYTWGITKVADLTQQNIPAGGSATFNYAVAVTHDSGTDSGWQVTGTITVTNPNPSAFTGVNVTDVIAGGGTCTVTGGSGATIPANGSADFAYACTYTSAPSPSTGTDTATATWDQAANHTPDSSASGQATAAFAAPTTIVDGSVTVADTLGGSLGTVSAADPSPVTFTYSHTFSGDPAGTCTTHTNTATFTTNTTGATGSASQNVTVCTGADLTVAKTATPSFTRTYTWGITKNADFTQQNIPAGGSATFNYAVAVTHDSGTDSGWQVTGTITVHNPNDWEAVTLTGVIDSIAGGGTCTVAGGSGAVIPANGSADFAYTCTYTSAPSPSTATDTATATWDPAAAVTPDGSASGTATATFSTPTTIVDGSVTVTDTLGGSLGTVSSTDPSPVTFTYPYTFSGDPAGTCTTHTNIATFTTNTTGATGSASQNVTVCVGADLTVAKTATPSFTRTYNWSISKSVDRTFFDAGGTAHYTVTVTETGFTDSGWQVTGAITVHNPNDWEAVTLTGVIDSIAGGGTCVVSGNTAQTIAAGGDSTGLTYTCTYAAAPNPASGANTATAGWDKTAAVTPDGSANGYAPFAFTTPAITVNKTVTVSDSIAGTLGTVTGVDTTPFTTATFTYAKKFTPPASGCVTVNNTATIVQTGQSASASVRVCNTGALTMGFWQNKNGQGIISGGAATGGVCNSGTWLRQYAPFQDLSSTATCSQVATYVYNIIKSANASGASMNAMLKAQLLATSLDVYFSDPALGGNKIGAPAPIGGVTIDLTNICKMIDSSNGTGTCSGTYENASSAFGGATSLTVSQMLAYAASQSSAGGSTWYGNVKATQQLAKDAFDAINNQVASSP